MDGGAAEGRDPRVDLLLEPDVLEHRRNSHPRLEMSSPPIPDDLLAPPSEEAAEETAFRLIWMARRGDKLVALVFSSSTGQWQDGPSHSWSGSFNGLLSLPGVATISPPHYAYGCFYWVTKCKEKLLVLDTRMMEFSIADAPPEAKSAGYLHIGIVEAGEGRIGMFVLPRGTFDLNFIIRRNKGGSSVQWQLDKTISQGFPCSFACSTGRHLFLEHNGGILSLDVRTFQLETVCASKYNHRMIFPRAYSNFPPSLLSSPTVASVEKGAEKDMLEQDCGASSSIQSPRSE